MLNNLNRQQLLQPTYGTNTMPNQGERNLEINRHISLETEIARARLRTHQALIQAVSANLDASAYSVGHSTNSFQSQTHHQPSSLPLHLPQVPTNQPLPSLVELTGSARYGPQFLNRNSNPFCSTGTGQVWGYLGAGETLRGMTQDSEGTSSSLKSSQSISKPFKFETTKEQNKTGGPKLSESEKKEHFPLPAKFTNKTYQADYTPPTILSNAEFRQKWKLIERQLAKKKATGKISKEAIGKIQRELFARAIQKGDMSHMYRRIHGIRTRSDEYGHLSKRPRYARKEG
eukprot:scaffold7101_cov153-Amphora_coffeaeformis.AAC.1